jgi:pimeloyl-ACP methyl ester carboxylesterase
MQTDVSGSGKPIVLVPGGLTGWLSWKPFAERLAATNRVIRTQLLAVQWGLEDRKLPDGYEVMTEVEALRNALDDLGIESADFAAWSYGAETTLSFAIHNPERVRTLTLIEPPAIWVIRSREELGEALENEREDIRELGPGEISAEQLVWFTHFAGFVPRDVDPRTLPQWPAWYEHRNSLRTQDVVFRHEDDIELVRAFDKPVLLFKGIGSSDWLHEIVDIFAEEFPNVKLVTLEGGHAPHLGEPDRFMEEFAKHRKRSKESSGIASGAGSAML